MFKEWITLNKKLIMYPIEAIDYVIIHELCHKTHANHQKRFYDMVESKMPDYKKNQKLLK
jgi:hypothetical protein